MPNMSKSHYQKKAVRESRHEQSRNKEQNVSGFPSKGRNYCSYFYRQPTVKEKMPNTPSLSNANTVAISKSRDLKKVRSSEMSIKTPNPHLLGNGEKKSKDEEINILRHQNERLRLQIAELKVTHFYQLSSDKLKSLVTEVEKYKAEINRLREENQTLKLENDFLVRANHQLKSEFKSITEPLTETPTRTEGWSYEYQLKTLNSQTKTSRKQSSLEKQTNRNPQFEYNVGSDKEGKSPMPTSKKKKSELQLKDKRDKDYFRLVNDRIIEKYVKGKKSFYMHSEQYQKQFCN